MPSAVGMGVVAVYAVIAPAGVAAGVAVGLWWEKRRPVPVRRPDAVESVAARQAEAAKRNALFHP
ncbi:hypothetical protein ACFZAR_36445 [Streptomyces sp. NPDC008222]|uniref:hypothetical protein n=1 Tax=Streptomyces sp. NPDC008222 TaxID=3364820 RepID=UPI0036E5E85D